MTAIRYGLTPDQRRWVEDVLSNDESSSEADLLALFTNQGLSQEQARSVLKHRDDYLRNIYLTGRGPLHDK